MSLAFDSQFAPVEGLTGEAIVECARGFLGLRYSSNTFVAQTKNGLVGFCDCAGLFLLTAIELRLLPAHFDPNLPRAFTGVSRETALKDILCANFTRVETARESLRVGDLLIVKWPDQNPDDFGRHMAIWTGENIIHAINDQSGTGSVREERLEAHMEPLVWRGYRMNCTIHDLGGVLGGHLGGDSLCRESSLISSPHSDLNGNRPSQAGDSNG